LHDGFSAAGTRTTARLLHGFIERERQKPEQTSHIVL
jgi:hypothetical protein